MTTAMHLVDLGTLSPAQREQLAVLTFEAARVFPRWLPTLDAAREELAEAQFARVLLDGDEPVAWAGAQHAWGRVWELHPLIVGVAHQRRGLGRRLVREIEAHAAAQGALTMMVGTSDETAATSLANTDLFVDPLGALATLELRAPHAVAFWQQVGYRIVGVVPDAEGPGMPSITLAKRL